MDQNAGQDTAARTSSEINALRNIRTFSLLSIFGFALDAVAIIFAFTMFSKLISSFATTSTASPAAYANLGVELAMGVLGLVSAILMLLSFVFLRRSYRVLKGMSEEFSSPYTGVNLFFIGLLVIIVGSIALIPLIMVHVSAVAVSIGIIVVLIVGVIMTFIGEILAIIVGPFKLRTYFNKPTFGTAGVMVIIGIFIPFISMVGVVLIYVGANSLLKSSPTVV